MKNVSYCILIGGGKSIRTYQNFMISLLKNKFTIAINYSFLYFPHTLLVFTDKSFYFGDNITHPNISHLIVKEPLIIGFESVLQKNKIYSNTILLKGNEKFYCDIIKYGLYTPKLSGIWALHLACWLLSYKNVIFLIGYDWGGSKDSHYYNNIQHRGLGYLDYYINTNADEVFAPFVEHTNCEIYNVIGDPESKINIFPKISYSTFLKRLKNLKNYNQEYLRTQILNKIKYEYS